VPHKHHYFLKSTDPKYSEKVKNIANIYKDIRDGNTGNKITISVDEKTAIRATKSIRTDIMPLGNKMSNNSYRLRDPEYKRLGVKNLIAGTNLHTGENYGLVTGRNRSCEFIEFLKILDASIDPNMTIRIVMDNYKTHNSKETQKYYSENPNRFELAFISSTNLPLGPTHSSWMNPIEGIFSKLSRGYLKDLRVESIDELGDVILGGLKELNESKKPANWDAFIGRYFNK
jgi:transposase